MANSKLRIPILSYGLWRLSSLKMFFSSSIKVAFLPIINAVNIYWLGWGAKSSAMRANKYAKLSKSQAIYLEDGFIRSYGVSKCFPQLSLVVDNRGIYYDSTRTSQLEALLDSSDDLLKGIVGDVTRAKHLVLEHCLSKYNHAPLLKKTWLRVDDMQRVLVIDQTVGDMSVKLGGADVDTFKQMLSAALDENPRATIYVKTHPEVTSGRKTGYLTYIENTDRVVVLREPINPISLLRHMDKVYVVTSGMGFEALLAAKPVSVFGMPWYAGWGATDDRQICERRTRKRTVDELFSAAYFHYTRYLNPVTHQRGEIFDVISWLVHQKQMNQKYFGRVICVGFRRWKAANIKPLLSLDQKRVVFVSNAKVAAALMLKSDDCIIYWGANVPNSLIELTQNSRARLLRMEDGFIRSVGLGSDLIKPLSLVLDEVGIYFDATRPSGLEVILNDTVFSVEELQQANQIRKFIVANGISKYNIEPRENASWSFANSLVILVPGQVEDDASIKLGSHYVKSNVDLLRKVREANPSAFIVYKPHPDVMSGNRSGKLAIKEALSWADHIESHLSVVSCIEACNEVHTMTSLTGFDALLRGKKVVVYGEPFYAGWGLTEDIYKDDKAFQRRKRKLILDELIAGTLIKYPIYWDWDLKGYTTCEAVLHRIVETRAELEANGSLHKLRLGYFRRQWRKIGILFKAWTRHH